MSRTNDYIIWYWEFYGVWPTTDESVDAEGFARAEEFVKHRGGFVDGNSPLPEKSPRPQLKGEKNGR